MGRLFGSVIAIPNIRQFFGCNAFARIRDFDAHLLIRQDLPDDNGFVRAGMVDGVIAPEDTREALASAMGICANKRVASPARKRPNIAF